MRKNYKLTLIFFTIELNKILTKFCDMCILLHKRKFDCFPHKLGSSHLLPNTLIQTGLCYTDSAPEPALCYTVSAPELVKYHPI